MYTKHAEFKAGIIVLAAVGALLALVYFAGGSEPVWGDYRYVNTRFEQGYVAPKVGDIVFMNGKPIGRVSDVQEHQELRGVGGDLPLTPADRRKLGLLPGEDGQLREIYVLAQLKLPAGQILPKGTTAQIGKSLTGIRRFSLLPGFSVENLTDEDARLAPIPARAAPDLADISSNVNKVVEKIDGLVAQGGDVMIEARLLLQTLHEKIDAFNTEELDREARAAISSLRRTVEGLETKLASIAANIEHASVDVRTIAEKGVGTIDDVRGDLREVFVGVKEVVAKLDRILADAKGPIDRFLADLETTGKNIAQLSTEFSGIGPEARKLLEDLGVDANALMRGLIDTAHNLLDASEDVRAHPWKLLNKPDDKEIAYENLRNAALNYTRTARDVNEVSARLKRLLSREDLGDSEVKQMISKALIEFRGAMDRYKTAERRWLELFQEAGRGGQGRAGSRRGPK